MKRPAISCFSAFLGVALGAFGAHALKTRVPPEALDVWHTGVQYHLVHSAAGLTIGMQSHTDARLPWILMMLGVLLFSGNCYLYVLTGAKPFALLIPVGGLCFLAAWVAMGVGLWRSKSFGMSGKIS